MNNTMSLTSVIRPDINWVVRRCAAQSAGGDAGLCAEQMQQHREGYRCAIIGWTINGWNVRSASGLDNWQILASVRGGDVDGSLIAAVEWATAWAAQAPGFREVLRRERWGV